MKNSITAIRVHALSIYAETSTNDIIDIITSGQLSDDASSLMEFNADYEYNPDTNTLYLEWEDADLMTTISWTFTLNTDTGWFEGK